MRSRSLLLLRARVLCSRLDASSSSRLDIIRCVTRTLARRTRTQRVRCRDCVPRAHVSRQARAFRLAPSDARRLTARWRSSRSRSSCHAHHACAHRSCGARHAPARGTAQQLPPPATATADAGSSDAQSSSHAQAAGVKCACLSCQATCQVACASGGPTGSDVVVRLARVRRHRLNAVWPPLLINLPDPDTGCTSAPTPICQPVGGTYTGIDICVGAHVGVAATSIGFRS